jgi:DNA-binding transcriptional regulator YdaS (Cro superfamily)
MSDKPTDTDIDTDTSISDPIPPLLFCRPEPMPSDEREAIENMGISPIQINRPLISIVNLSALAERIERAVRGEISEHRDGDSDHNLLMQADRDAIWNDYRHRAGNASLPTEQLPAAASKARVDFVLNLLKTALGGH